RFALPPEGWYMVGPGRWFEWALGATAVEAYLGMIKLPRALRSGWVGLALLALAIAVKVPAFATVGGAFIPLLSDPLFGASFFVLLNAIVAREAAGRLVVNLPVRALAWVGVCSYSLYLTHYLVMGFAKQIGLRLGLGVPGVVVLRIALPLAV